MPWHHCITCGANARRNDVERTILVRMTEQEALDISILMTEKLADLTLERRTRLLEWSELRLFESIRRVQDKIDIMLLALHQNKDRPILRLVKDGKSQD